MGVGAEELLQASALTRRLEAVGADHDLGDRCGSLCRRSRYVNLRVGRSHPARHDFPRQLPTRRSLCLMLESMCSSFMTFSACSGAWEKHNLWTSLGIR